MTSKYTLGPWHVKEQSGLDGLPDYMVFRYGHRIAHCNWQNELPSGAAEAKANAALISSAPDMFSALQRAAMVIHDLSETHSADPTFNEDGDAYVTLECIRAAIAKAKGQE